MAEIPFWQYGSAREPHVKQMKDQFQTTKVPKMVQLLSQKMHKRLKQTSHNPEIEQEVTNFVHLGQKDFSEKGLRRLENKLRANLGMSEAQSRVSHGSSAMKAGMEIMSARSSQISKAPSQIPSQHSWASQHSNHSKSTRSFRSH